MEPPVNEIVMPDSPEAWLRGPLPGLPLALQPVGHALVAALEEVGRLAQALPPSHLWREPGGAASIGFHLLHLSGSTDRLFTYARGEVLSPAQRSALSAERQLPDPRPPLETLLAEWQGTVRRALDQLGQTPDGTLDESRPVGRAQRPATVRGLLFHAAEHAQRHVGQITTTARILQGLAL